MGSEYCDRRVYSLGMVLRTSSFCGCQIRNHEKQHARLFWQHAFAERHKLVYDGAVLIPGCNETLV